MKLVGEAEGEGDERWEEGEEMEEKEGEESREEGAGSGKEEANATGEEEWTDMSS